MTTTDPAAQRQLPAKRMGAGAVIRDATGRILVVNPTYKDVWELPGGIVEHDESPASACRRELHEELDLDLTVGDLLCVDYNAPEAGYAESLMFLFDGGSLTEAQEAAIRLPAGELSEWRFCELPEALRLLDPRVGRRLAAVVDGTQLRHGLYLEDQTRPAAER